METKKAMKAYCELGALNNVARVQAWVNPNNGISNAISNIR